MIPKCRGFKFYLPPFESLCSIVMIGHTCISKFYIDVKITSKLYFECVFLATLLLRTSLYQIITVHNSYYTFPFLSRTKLVFK